jgi:hypothetical protein
MSQYQPPLSPYFSGVSPGSSIGGNLAIGRNPFFTIANQYLPRNLHDVIRWARYITSQSPVVTEVVRKLSTYPITDFIVDTESEPVRKIYKDIFSSFDLKSSLHDIGFEYYTIGNVFLSLYFPIHRTLQCPKCLSEFNAKTAEFTKVVNYEFRGQCPKCSATSAFIRKDTKSVNIEDMNIIKWDPLNIAVNHNPITNEYRYYYRIPNEVKRRVQMGDKLFLNSVPWSLIEAIKNNQDFEFDSNNIFHLRNLSTGQIVEGVSIPPLISQFNLVFYQTTLRRANESVAQDYMAPIRVVYPQAQTANSDPVVALSLRNFANNMSAAFKQHKTDNNGVVISPVPVGYEAISGEGKNLLVTTEIAQSEEFLLLSLGVSRELLSGTTNWTSSTVGLRMMESTLSTYVGQIEKFINWAMTRTSKYLGVETCNVNLTPFKLTDDDSLRQVLLNLAASGNASMTSLFESYNMDYKEELARIREDAVAKAVNEARTQIEVERGVFLASKNMGSSKEQNEEYSSALQQAHQIVDQLTSAPETQRRAYLAKLKAEDYGTWLMVSKLLEETRRIESAQLAMAAPMAVPQQEGVPEGQEIVPAQAQQEQVVPT